MKSLNSIVVSGKEVLPLIEGGKGVAVSSGESSGAWAAAGGVATFSGVNADSYDDEGNIIPQTYQGRTRRDRHEELIAYGIKGGIAQAKIAHEIAGGNGAIHMNVLWEMGGAEEILRGVLEGAPGLIDGVTCGAGMPYRVAQIAADHKIHYYPIISSARAFRALWKRAYHKFADWLGGVVYEDPWLAGGHNGLTNSEDAMVPEDPYPRVALLRTLMNEMGLNHIPIVMAGGVWQLDDWAHWFDNPEIGPITFQFGTRPLLTQESPISSAWKKKLITLKKGDIFLNKFSPTGFWSSAVRNDFLGELKGRSDRQVAFVNEPTDDLTEAFSFGARKREIYLTPADKANAENWMSEGYSSGLKTPDSTMIFVAPDKMAEIRKDQVDCMGCLSQCSFSNWSEGESGNTGRKADPRSFCIQKTLQDVIHTENVDNNLMFAGHGAYRFGTDPFYANGFVPTVQELIDRIMTGK